MSSLSFVNGIVQDFLELHICLHQQIGIEPLACHLTSRPIESQQYAMILLETLAEEHH